MLIAVAGTGIDWQYLKRKEGKHLHHRRTVYGVICCRYRRNGDISSELIKFKWWPHVDTKDSGITDSSVYKGLCVISPCRIMHVDRARDFSSKNGSHERLPESDAWLAEGFKNPGRSILSVFVIESG